MPATPKKKPFAVYFRDGTVIRTTADNALRAEQKARRQHAGFVAKVRFAGRLAHANR